MMVGAGPLWAGNSTVTFRVREPGPPVVWSVVSEYLIGELLPNGVKVWVQVDDPDFKAPDYAIGDSIWVRVFNPNTGDMVDHKLQVTQLFNPPITFTGIAQTTGPISLVPATASPTLTDSRLEVRPGDIIYVRYMDPKNPSDVAEASAQIPDFTDPAVRAGKVFLYEGTPVFANLRAVVDDRVLAHWPGGAPALPPNAGPIIATVLLAEWDRDGDNLVEIFNPHIKIGAGDYVEEVNVGANVGGIGQPAPWAGGIVIESDSIVRIFNVNAGTPPLTISTSNVTIRGLVLMPQGAGTHGIQVNANLSGIELLYNTIIVDPQGNGINFGGAITGTRIEGNVIEPGLNGPQHGIYFGGNVTSVQILANRIEEAVDHGIHFFGGTLDGLLIRDNQILNCNRDRNTNRAGAGVRFGDPTAIPPGVINRLRAVTIEGNRLEGNEHGIQFVSLPTGAGNIESLIVRDNQIFDHRWAGDGNQEQAGIHITGAGLIQPTNFRIEENEIAGNEVGIYMDGFIQYLDIWGNNIAGNVVGVQLANKDNTINNNDIVGNELWGINAQLIGGAPSQKVNAMNNWWGHASGPYHYVDNPDGVGDAVTDHVEFEPWLTASAGGAPAVLEFTDTEITPTGTGYVQLIFNASGLEQLDVGPMSVLLISDSSLVDVDGVVGVDPYEVANVTVNDPDTPGSPITIQFEVFLLPGQVAATPGPIVQINLTGTAAHGDVVTVTISPLPLDRCIDGAGNTIPHHSLKPGTITFADWAVHKGDVDGNGTVDITDARWVAEYVVGLRGLSDVQKQAADVNGDGAVDITDARCIANYAVSGTWTCAAYTSSHSFAGTALVQLEQGVLTVTEVPVAEVQGRILFDPTTTSIEELEGINGYQVLAWALDPIRGEVRFVAVRPGAPVEGPVLQVEGSGDSSALAIELEVLRSGDSPCASFDVPYQLVPAAPSVFTAYNLPNPVTDLNTTYFFVNAAVTVEAIRVQIFDLAGRLIWDSGWGENGLAWHLNSIDGAVVANGVYLYRVTVRFLGVETTLSSGLRKLAVYR
ncbi:MAG: hypothetical protein DRI26_07680 [Chloroflexi bacterium]|nr:MAG: hypothetical protein DRI26_07680 [Chloroflexota bacterium]